MCHTERNSDVSLKEKNCVQKGLVDKHSLFWLVKWKQITVKGKVKKDQYTPQSPDQVHATQGQCIQMTHFRNIQPTVTEKCQCQYTHKV